MVARKRKIQINKQHTHTQ